MKALQNKILEAQNPVGCKKPNNWKLPPEGFAYGLPNKPDKYNAGVSKSFRLFSH